MAEYEKSRDKLKDYDFRYIKGLGSLEVDEYRRAIQEPVYDIVKLDKDYRDIFNLLYGSDTDIRKAWMSTGKIPRDEDGNIE